MGLFDAIGSIFGGGDGGASDTQKKALEEFSKIDIPDPEEMKVKLEGLVRQGVITPEQAQSFLVQKTAMTDVRSDPESLTAARQALAGLQDVYQQGGLTDIDRARIADIQDQEAQAERGSREAILQNARERGVGGSGLELAAQLNNQQAAIGRKAKQDVDVAASAQARALEAMKAAGTQGAQLQGQLYGQEAEKAKAADEIAKFNAATQTQTSQFNTGVNNAAQIANLKEKQRIADTNVATKNAQEAQNKGVAQTNFNNQITKASGMGGQYDKIAQTQLEEQKRKENLGAGVLNTGASLLALSDGGRIPGDPEEDDPANDVIPALLSPGETVVPASIADDPASAAEFAANPPPAPAPKTTINPVVAEMLRKKYSTAPGAGANNSTGAPADTFSPEARQKNILEGGEQTPSEIAARILAGISDSVLNANQSRGSGSKTVSDIIEAKRGRRKEAFEAGRADEDYTRKKAAQALEDDPASDVSRTYQSLAAKYTRKPETDFEGRSATQLKSVLPILEKAYSAEEAAKSRAEIADMNAKARTSAAGMKDTFEEKEEIKKKVKAKAEYFEAKAFVPGSVKILDELSELNKKSFGGAIQGIGYKLTQKTGIGEDSEKFRNTTEIVNSLRQMVSKVLKATFGGQLSDGERAYLDTVYGAAPQYTKTEREIAIKNVRRMFTERLQEKQTAYESWVNSPGSASAPAEKPAEQAPSAAPVADSADYLPADKAKRLKELRAKVGK